MPTVPDLTGLPEWRYRPHYHDHVLAIYKLYVKMADTHSQRRHTTNSFFLSVNSAAATLMAVYIGLTTKPMPDPVILQVLLAVAGMLLSFLWWLILGSYKDVISAKGEVIHTIEQYLPFPPYCRERVALDRGNHLYRKLTDIEDKVPILFMVCYVILLLLTLYRSDILSLYGFTRP